MDAIDLGANIDLGENINGWKRRNQFRNSLYTSFKSGTEKFLEIQIRSSLDDSLRNSFWSSLVAGLLLSHDIRYLYWTSFTPIVSQRSSGDST